MGSRRPPHRSNLPQRNAQYHSYVQLAQTSISPPLNDAHRGSYDPIEEEIDVFLQTNAYENDPEYAFNQLRAFGHLEDGGYLDEYTAHPSEELILTQEEEEYLGQYDFNMSQEQYQFEPIETRQDVDWSHRYEHPREHGVDNSEIISHPSHVNDASSVAGTRLKPISHLPDLYRGIFKKFGVFNAVQSACFDDIMNSNKNMVISAPTGSGKTVLFELAIIRTHINGARGKCVYIAPTKALCAEKYDDWSAKFEPLGLKCYELTGDTDTAGRGVWKEAKNASIIVTTGEKWDSVTRNWKDHQRILDSIHLFLVDEVHILGDSRGGTLEVVVSRMKMRGPATRFILVSATIPNIDDIAAWISSQTPHSLAKVVQFGEEYRPCRLSRHVVGLPRRKDWTSFQFDKSLDAKLYSVIQMHTAGKPILIFVSTRKGVFITAEVLAKCYNASEKKKEQVPWSRPSRINAMFMDKRLGELAAVGIGVHHAGLAIEDRKLIEQLYIRKSLQVLVATSTLAVGVNLPAHFVIIKGVQLWQNGRSSEYSDLDIMQMLGRAGRPQFDTEGIAAIMCEQELVPKYQSLTQGMKVLESYLHHNLSEHINSEIGLGTITDVESAKSWLRGSFFFQRVRKNHNFYAVDEDDQSANWQDRMDSIITSSIQNLQDCQLVKEMTDSPPTLALTDFGEVMSKFYIRQNTMADMITSQDSSLRGLRDYSQCELISRCEEFSENKIRQTEKTICNVLRRHPEVRFEMKKVETTADKVLVLIQAVLGGISLNAAEFKTHDCQLYMEAGSIFRHVNRLARVIVEVATINRDGRRLQHALELGRCLTAKAWEDRPIVLRQISLLGEKSIKILAEHGITNFEKLRTRDPYVVESLLNRGSGFGHNIIALAEAMPRYYADIKQVCVVGSGGERDVEVELSITCGLLNGNLQPKVRDKKQPKKVIDMTSILTVTSDYDWVDFRRTQTKDLTPSRTFDITAKLTRPSQSILVIIASETIAGTTLQVEYKPRISSSEFPVPRTRPPTSTEIDLEGLEDDPDFWKMGVDDSESSMDPPNRGPMLPKKKEATKSDCPKEKKKKSNDPSQTTRTHNGNYECNHSCHDKGNCRHLCCRQGLSNPPNQPKGREEKEKSFNISEKNDKKPTSGVKRLHKPFQQDDKKLDDLQRHHQNASVSQNLCLSSGQRLKLEPGLLALRKKKTRQAPSYDLLFADLGETSAPKADDNPVSSDELSGDELPTSVVAYLATEKKEPPKAKPAAVFVGLKRVASTISLSSDDDGGVQPPPGAQPSKRPRKAPSPADEVDFGPPLFCSSDDDILNTPLDLMDGLEEYLSSPKEPKQAPESSDTLATQDDGEETDELAELEAWLNGDDVEYF